MVGIIKWLHIAELAGRSSHVPFGMVLSRPTLDALCLQVMGARSSSYLPLCVLGASSAVFGFLGLSSSTHLLLDQSNL
jgi:hypothetical protein